MKISKKIVTILLICFLTFSILSILGRRISPVGAQPIPEFPLGYGASLTGKVYDEGVDTDDDGLFDYLQISVEVNVTSPWMLYSVEVYEHGRYGQVAFVYPKTGLQLVNFFLHGPTIHDSGLNLTGISQITLSETSPTYSPYYGFSWYSNTIDSLYHVHLSREYSYTEFDPPFTDVEAKFVVYPDGRVVIGGELNFTPTMSSFTGMPSLKDLVMQGDASLTRTGLLTVISQNNTVLLPPEYASKFPLNSTTMSMFETYSGDVLNTGTNCTVILPSDIASKFPFNSTDASLSETYSKEGVYTTEIDYTTTVPTAILPPDFEVPPGSEQLFDFIHFLLNSTDISMVGQYQNGDLSGNITISMLPGFVLGNLDIDFQGNQTDFSLNGDMRVFYGSFYDREVDEENLDMMLLQLNSTIIGEGAGSLYDLTEGALNCTKLTTVKTPITVPLPGADIHFEMDIKGDFVKAVANSVTSALMPRKERERIYEIISLVEDLRYLIYEETGFTNEAITSLEDLAEAIPEEEERIYEIIASLEDLMLLIDEEEVRIDEIVDSLEYLERLITGEEKDEIAEEISAVIVSLNDLLDSCMNETQSIGEIFASLEGLAEVVPEEQREQIYDLIDSLGHLGYLTDQKVDLVSWSIDSLERLPEYIAQQEEEREQIRALIYSALNTTISSIQKTSFELGYTYSTREASMGFTFVDDVRSVVDELLPLVPQIDPSIPDILPDILNKTFSCTKTASVQMAYTKADGKFDFKRTAVVEGLEQVREEATQLIVEMLQNVTLIPPEVMPSEMRTLIVSLLNTTYCSLESYESSLTYEDGRQDMIETYTIQGDLNAELNYVKEIFFETILAPYDGYHTPVPWQLAFINQTEMDIRNLRASYNFTEILITGSIDGFGIWPPIDVINATRFQLKELFSLTNSTYPYEPPRRGERLKITIEGGSDITHRTTLFRPTTVSEPDETASDMRRMVWYNQTLSSLQDMMFDIQLEPGIGEFKITYPELVNETDPYIADAKEKAATVIEITGISKPAKLYVANMTEPPEGGESPPGTYKVLGKYVYVECTEMDVDVNATIRIYYTQEQLSAAGLDENTLKIHCWNATLGEWDAIDSHVNTAEHYVWATIDHFSYWTVMGQPSLPIWTEPWFLIVIGVIVVVIVAVLAYAVKRKKPLPQ